MLRTAEEAEIRYLRATRSTAGYNDDAIATARASLVLHEGTHGEEGLGHASGQVGP